MFINFNANLLAELSLDDYEPFEWPKIDSIHLKTENEALPDMIKHLSTYINIEPYQIRNVKNQNSFIFSFALENSIYNGRPDAVIVPKNSFSSIFQTRVVFEFKTSESMNKSQRKLELMASSIAAFHPVLVVQTDLKTFYLLVCYDKKIFQYYSKDAKQAIDLINYWLKHLCNPSHEFSYLENQNQSFNPYIESMIDLKLLNSKAVSFHKRIKYIVMNCYSENETNEISNKSEQEKDRAKKRKVCLSYFKQLKRTRIFKSIINHMR